MRANIFNASVAIVLAGSSCAESPTGTSGTTRRAPPPPSAAEAAAPLGDLAKAFGLLSRQDEALAALRLAGGPTATEAVHSETESEAECVQPMSLGSIIFSQTQLGRTYEWDSDLGTYVAGDEPGANPCGIRIVVYSLDGSSGEPALPLDRLGIVEVVDTGSLVYAGGNTHALALRVITEPAAASDTVAWYVTKSWNGYSTSGSSSGRSLEGWFEGATGQRLTVNHSSSLSQHSIPWTSAETLSYSLAGDSVVAEREGGAWLVRVRMAAGVVEMVCATGEVSFDPEGDVPAAVVAGTDCAGDFTAPDGAPLDAAVAGQFQDFWAALSNSFGVAAWPEV